MNNDFYSHFDSKNEIKQTHENRQSAFMLILLFFSFTTTINAHDYPFILPDTVKATLDVDISSQEPTITLIMDSTIYITANFDQISSAVYTKNAQIRVYPNPSTDGLFNLSEDIEWEVYSIQGVKVIEGKGKAIDLATFNKGIFILKTKYDFFKLIKK